MTLPLAQLSVLSDLNVTPPSHVPSSDSWRLRGDVELNMAMLKLFRQNHPVPYSFNIHQQPHNKVTQNPKRPEWFFATPTSSTRVPGPAFSHRIGNPTTSSLELCSGVLAGECFSCTLLISMTEEALASLSSATLGMEACTSPITTQNDWVDFE